MLKSLYIRNVALISETSIEFTRGLNVLSGETGAGKSIIIDSLAFALGERADKSLIKSGEESAFVEAVFSVPEKDNVFEQNGYESDDGLYVVARTMSVSGKNEIRINGRVTPQGVLKRISAALVDIFSQNQHTYLLKPENHLHILDGFRHDPSLSERVASLSAALDEINAGLGKFGMDDSQRERMLDMLNYQIREIESAEFYIGEDDELQQLRKKGQNAEKISYALSSAIRLLDGDGGALCAVGDAASAMASVSGLDNEYEDIRRRLESTEYELRDLADTLDGLASSLSFDSFEQDRIETRLDKLKLLKKKYGGSLQAVSEFLAEAKAKADEITGSDKIIEKLKKEKEAVLDKLYGAAYGLSAFRREAAAVFSGKIMSELNDLGMKNTSFEVRFGEIPPRERFDGCDKNGFDTAEFYFSANKGEPSKPLAKIISGGEMSRFMLALKNITASIEKIPTMVFDEIDSGISGKIAEVVAKKLARVSSDYQCLVITHLPQIAAMSDEHLLIQKTVNGEKTVTSVTALDENGKIKEIGRLVAGGIGAYGELHAKDLVKWADDYKESVRK